MSDTMYENIDDGLRFQNCNCFSGLRASVRISNKRNENRYRLFQCCSKGRMTVFSMMYSLEDAIVICGGFPATTRRNMCIARGIESHAWQGTPLRLDNKNGEDYVHWIVFVLHRACITANYDNYVNHQLGWCVRSYFVTIFSYYVLLTPFELDALCTIFRQSWVIHFASVYNMYGADSWLLQ